MRKLQLIPIVLSISFVALFITSCRKDEPLYVSLPAEVQDAQIAHDWFDKFRFLTKNCAGFTPPVASRAFGYAGVTLYEAIVPGMPQYQSLQGQLQDMPKISTPDLTLEYNWAIATNAAMAYVAKNYYANMSNSLYIDVVKLEENSNIQIREKYGISDATFERSKKWGQEVARVIFEWSKTDGGHEGYTKNFPTSYKAPIGAGLWVPTYPKFQSALQPYWGTNRTFVTRNTSISQPSSPTPYSEDTASTFYKEAYLVYSSVKNIKPEEKIIAQFWSDDPGQPGTPPGHSISIATQILKKEAYNLAKSAEVYAKVGMGVSDAFVSCWYWKYQYNYIRPISFIRSKIDPTFVSLLETPPFPEYTSGHSVQSGATAKILTEIFGNNYEFVDATHANRTDINGTPRTFKSFYDFAAEAAISRLYGGIHYREAIEKGVEQGVKIGTQISKLTFRKP
ncbi:MAG: vanadium-dependent haloperoxidase [Saprospiraceae bacterium]|nr:vanadium-dependent haloperoxidase [Saprospiraceae bacterium]